MSENQEKKDSDKPPTAEDGGEGTNEAAGGENANLLESTTSNVSTHEWLREYFTEALGISNKPPPEKVLEAPTFEAVANYIKSDRCKNICTMTGAGISTSAGIPDFRSPGSGLYDNLEKYNLPSPNSIFSIDYFEEHPEAFFELAKELMPSKYKPTPCHYFIKLLNDKGKLHTHYTQNVDTLENVAGLPEDKYVEAHGSFQTSHCLQCRDEYSFDWMKEQIFDDKIPRCVKSDCDGIVKPDIVFFGEPMPKKFFEYCEHLNDCDLLIIMGTSLVVHPFASLTNRVKNWCPRLYINLENTASSGGDAFTALLFGGGGNFTFDSEDNFRDVFWQGTCDAGCYALADLLGWGDELRELVKTEHARMDMDTMTLSEATNKSSSATSKSSPKISPKASDEKSNAAAKKDAGKDKSSKVVSSKTTPNKLSKTPPPNKSSKTPPPNKPSKTTPKKPETKLGSSGKSKKSGL